MKTKLTGFLLTTALILVMGCNQKQLKKPAGTGGDNPPAAATMSEDDVRNMAQVFAQEFAAELKRQNVTLANGGVGQTGSVKPVEPVGRPVKLNSAPDVMEFYSANPEGFTVAQPGDLPSGLEWVSGSELEEFASPDAKRGGTFMEYTSDYPRTLRFVGPDANGAFRSCSITTQYIS